MKKELDRREFFKISGIAKKLRIGPERDTGW
jgi:hypothetical protein